MSKPMIAVGTTLILLAVAVIVILVVAYGGVVNVAADQPHLPGVEWFLETTQENSLEKLAKRADSVPPFTPEMRKSGLHHYHEMCVTCHGAPGLESSEIGKGLNPSPPDLSKEIHPPQADFWVVKHGIRMTGMPAFGLTHSDEEIWGIVAFLEELPKLNSEEYARRVRQAGMQIESGHGHEGSASEEHGAKPQGQSKAESSTTGHAHEDGAPHSH